MNDHKFSFRHIKLTPEAKEQLKKLPTTLRHPTFSFELDMIAEYKRKQNDSITLQTIHSPGFCWHDDTFPCPHNKDLTTCPPGGCLEILHHLEVLKKEEKKDV